MAIDSTELTFVRCPSCRSLVPAVSTRCRMCGASLDVAGGQAGAAEVSSEPAAPTSDDEEQHATAGEDPLGAESDDPLSAYIDEVDVADDDSDDDILSDDEFDELLDSILDPADEDDVDVLDDLADQDPLDAMDADDEAMDEPEPQPASNAQDDRGVIIESGRRKPGQKSQLSFGGSKATDSPEEDERQDDEAEIEAVQPEPEPELPTPEPKKEERVAAKPEPEPQKQVPVEDDARASRPSNEEDQPQPRPKKKPKSKKVKARPKAEASQRTEQREEPTVVEFKKASKGNDQAGRLFGWLVSYATPDGASIEIREGKFFISGSQIRGNDLVLQHDSVSSPHAMVTVSASGGFRVQDLMSEEGIFVRAKGSGSYQPVDEVVSLENGMWVRFGDVEFLVSLIPYVGQA